MWSAVNDRLELKRHFIYVFRKCMCGHTYILLNVRICVGER